jgi:hypothetical protein
LSPQPDRDVPFIQIPFYTFSGGDVTIELQFTLVLENQPEKRKSYEIGLDDSNPASAMLLQSTNKGDLPNGWAVAVKDGVWKREHRVESVKPGAHMLKYRTTCVDLALEKVILDFGGVRSSYLGPTASCRV